MVLAHYMYPNHMGWGWGLLMTVGWLILLGLFLALLISAMRERRSGPSARELLDQRLASGEISLEEYRQARAAMSPQQSDVPTGPPAPA
jgi:uncharacterized membrane protein